MSQIRWIVCRNSPNVCQYADARSLARPWVGAKISIAVLSRLPRRLESAGAGV